MFTGIIHHCTTISELTALPSGRRMTLLNQHPELTVGESIAIDGICLTVTQFDDTSFSFDLSPETLAITTAASFRLGQSVNIERALLASSRMGGHFVTGHVDQTAKLQVIRPKDAFVEMIFADIHAKNRHFLVPKGSITINGVSLTINAVDEDTLSVMLIPHTLEHTNLSLLQPGDSVNVEFDMMARLITQQIQHYLEAGVR